MHEDTDERSHLTADEPGETGAVEDAIHEETRFIDASPQVTPEEEITGEESADPAPDLDPDEAADLMETRESEAGTGSPNEDRADEEIISLDTPD